MTTYRIAEVAERTGFPPATLRYYEEVGVVPPPPRTAAGYRVYDERAVERLRFVARAKELGCSLEEVADLASAWDRDDCAPVQHRLRGLVAAKVAELDRRMAELAAFRADLTTAGTALATAPLDGPCGGGCGCLGEPAVVCTIGEAEVPDRTAVLERLRVAATSVERTATGLVLRFAGEPGTAADVRRFTVDEQRCCAFWRFRLAEEGDELVLHWDGPPDAAELVDRLAGLLGSDDPMGDLFESG